jgi:hypothetical protein
MTGVLRLDLVGVGGAAGAAIRGGEAGIITASSLQRGPVHLAQLEVFSPEQAAQHPLRAP